MITYTYTCMLKELLLHFEHDTLKFLRVGKTRKYSRKKFKKVMQTLSMPKNALDLPIFPSNPDL